MQMLSDLETFSESEEAFLRLLANFLSLDLSAVRIQSVAGRSSRRLQQSRLDVSVETDVSTERASAATSSLQQDSSLDALIISAGLPHVVVLDVVQYCGDGQTLVQATCQLCPEGSYKSEPDNSSCVQCPLNAGTAGSGSARVAKCLCSAGFFLALPPMSIAGSCTACPTGFFCEGGSARVGCPEHSTSGAGSARREQCVCDAGYTPEEASAGCRACAPGTRKAGAGSGLCEQCTGGSVQPAPAATTCLLCPPDSLPNPPATHCFPALDPPACISHSLTLAADCPTRSIPARGCATSLEQLQTTSLPIETHTGFPPLLPHRPLPRCSNCCM
eukprot:2545703-Rhodomonas_salina.1